MIDTNELRVAAERLRLYYTTDYDYEDRPKGFHADVERLLAEHPAADGEPVTGWRPIETAPKDGTWVILFTPAGVQCGYWGGTYFGKDPAWIQYAHRSDYEAVEGEPTHWMPLPEPPTEPAHV